MDNLAAMQVIKNDQFLKALGNRLREIRKKKGLTQEQLAALVDMEGPNISRIERGAVNPGAMTLYLLSQGLGVHLKELLNFEL